MIWRISKAVDMFQYQLSIPQVSDWLFQPKIKRFIQQKAHLELFLKLQKDPQSWLELTVEKNENETFTGFPRKLLLKILLLYIKRSTHRWKNLNSSS